MDKICVICGCVFSTNRPQTITCSPECSHTHKLLKKKESNRKRYIDTPAAVQEKTCEFCGKPFSTLISTQRFCSEKCRDEATLVRRRAERRENKTEVSAEKVCVFCGKTFTVKGKHAIASVKYCSDACRAEQNRIITRESQRKYLTKKPDTNRLNSSKYSRRCHDCGRPTNDYRCEICNQKIRRGCTVSDGWEFMA